MTTTQLVDMASGYRWFKNIKVQLTPGEVKAAGSLAQSELCSSLEILDGRSYIDLVAGTSEYSLPENVIRIKGERMLFVNGQVQRPIKMRTSDEIESLNEFSSGNVRLFYVRAETTVVVGFKGVPDVAARAYYRFYRKPLASEALSDTQDPIIPSPYDMLFYWYTMRQLVEIYKTQPDGERQLSAVKQTCLEKQQEALAIKLRRGFTSESDYESIRW